MLLWLPNLANNIELCFLEKHTFSRNIKQRLDLDIFDCLIEIHFILDLMSKSINDLWIWKTLKSGLRFELYKSIVESRSQIAIQY